MPLGELYDYLLATGLFRKGHRNENSDPRTLRFRKILFLNLEDGKESNKFGIYFNFSHWFDEKGNFQHSNWCFPKHWVLKLGEKYWEYRKLEDILEEIPQEVQEKLLFHLDVINF